jgi:hypothetical protein
LIEEDGESNGEESAEGNSDYGKEDSITESFPKYWIVPEIDIVLGSQKYRLGEDAIVAEGEPDGCDQWIKIEGKKP